eukprot:jgi/Undpi1/1570/HiC_scaffold_11.g04960.m1
MLLTCPPSFSKIDKIAADGNNQIEQTHCSPPSPVAPRLRASEMVELRNLRLQRLTGVEGQPLTVEDEKEEKKKEEGDFDDMPSLTSFSSSRRSFMWDDGLSSDEDGAESDEEGWGVDAAVNEIFELFDQGYQGQQQQDVKVGATNQLKMVLGYIVHRLDTAEDERGTSKDNENRLRRELAAEQKQHALARESFSTRAAEIAHSLEKAKISHTKLAMKHASLVADKARRDETNRVLQAKVVRLTDTLADFIVNISAPAEPRRDIDVETTALGPSTPISSGGFVVPEACPAEGSLSISAATAANESRDIETATGGLGASTPALSADFVGTVVSPAEEPSSSSATAAPKGKKASSLPAVTPSIPRAEVAPMSEPFAAVFPVDKVMASPSAVCDVVEAMVAGVVDLGSSTSTSSVCAVVPAVNLAEGPSPSAAVTVAKGKTAPSLQTLEPFRPRAEVANPSSRFSTAFPVGKMASSSPTPSRSKQPSASKGNAMKLSANEEDDCHALDLKSSLVEEEPDKVCGASRRHTRRPLTPVNSNFGRGKRAAAAERPAFSVRAATNPYQRRSSIVGEVPSLASRGVTKKSPPKPIVNSSSTGREVLPRSSRREAKPTVRLGLNRGSTEKEVSSLAARGAAGSAEKNEPVGKGPAVEVNESVGKGPAVKLVRGGGARPDGLVRGKGSGGGRNMEVASSGRVLRSATRPAAAAAAANIEGGTSAASGTVPAADVAGVSVQPTRSGRSATRR